MPLKLIAPGTRKGNRYWLARGSIRGRRYEVSTETTNKKAAAEFAASFEAKLRTTAPQRGAVTLSEAIDLYVAWRSPDKRWLRAFEKLRALLGNKLLADLRQTDLVDAADIICAGRKNETKNRTVIAPASAVLHYAADNDLCDWSRIRRFKEAKPVPRAVEKDVFEVLRAGTDGKKRLLIVFLFRQGWRISEALSLSWPDIDLGRGEVKHRIAKTDEWRVVALHNEVLALLGATSGVGRLFPWHSRSGVYKWLRPLCTKLGVAFTPHRARHSFATWLVQAGAELGDLMEAGGWKDHKSVLRYGKTNRERIRALINKAAD